jgi:hypothetical protein
MTKRKIKIPRTTAMIAGKLSFRYARARFGVEVVEDWDDAVDVDVDGVAVEDEADAEEDAEDLEAEAVAVEDVGTVDDTAAEL